MKEEKIKLTWKDIEDDVRRLSNLILNDGFKPDIVIAIGEGGWIPARLLKNFIKVRFYSICAKNYDENDNILDDVYIFQCTDKENIEDKKVLVVDEVADSGKTLKKIVEYLDKFNPKELKTAVLNKKAHSIYHPDYVVNEVGNEWIQHPWELK